MEVFECILLIGLIITAIAAPLQKTLLGTVLVFTAFGLIMSVLWMVLAAPDLAITEAAVGAGVTGVLFFLTLKKIGKLHDKDAGKKRKKHK